MQNANIWQSIIKDLFLLTNIQSSYIMYMEIYIANATDSAADGLCFSTTFKQPKSCTWELT